MRYSLPNEWVEVKQTVEQDKSFPGRNIGQMPLLLGEGRSPWPATRFMRNRIDYAHEFLDLRSYLDVSDLIAYDSKKRSTDVKFILTVDKNGRVTEQGRKALELINPNAELTSDYATNVTDVYDYLPGIVVARKDLGILERNLTEEEILGNKAWRILARHPDEVPAEFAEDPNLLKEYAGWVKGQTKQDTNMGVYLDSNSKDAKFRAFCVGRLDFRSGLYGWSSLYDDRGRLVGYLAPEVLGALGEGASNIENRVTVPTLEQVLAVVKEYTAEINRNNLEKDLRRLYK